MPSLDRMPGAGMIVTREGIVVDWNDRCRVIFGEHLDGLGGEHLEVLRDRGALDRDALGNWASAIERAAEREGRTTARIRLLRNDQSESVQYELVVDAQGPDRLRCTLRTVGTSQRYAETLTALHAATRELMTAEDTRTVLQRTADAADEVLGFPGTGVREYDPESELLRHVGFGAQVGDIDSRPPYPIDGTPHGRALQRGRTVIDDIGQNDPYDRGVFTQTMYIPIGDRGLLSVGTVGGSFDETDVQFAEILAENAAAAITVVETSESLRRERERLDLLKRILSRVLRHNIRNDVNVIRGNAERLDRDDEITETIRRCTDDILSLSEKARDIERIVESPRTRRPIDSNQIVEDAVDGVRKRYPGATIDCDLRDDGPILAHETIGIAVENLLENACEHADTGRPSVIVRTAPDGEMVRVEVIDDGPGIPQDEIDVLLAEQETALWHGSGLGLWLVKLAVDTVDGEIEFDTGADGTHVTLLFDRAPATSGGTNRMGSAGTEDDAATSERTED